VAPKARVSAAFCVCSVVAVGIGLKAALSPRKLLILRIGKMAKSHEFAEARYTAGTRYVTALNTREARLGPVHGPRVTCLGRMTRDSNNAVHYF